MVLQKIKLLTRRKVMSNPNNNKNFNDEALRINRTLKRENDKLKEEIQKLQEELNDKERH